MKKVIRRLIQSVFPGFPDEPDGPRDGFWIDDFESHRVRRGDVAGRVCWVLADVCESIGIGNPRDVVGRLDDDEKGVVTIDTLGGPQSVNVVFEPGLYRLIFESRKPEAKRFKRWVFHEVLPSIRRTGRYQSQSHDRVAREAKRLGCDRETAKARCDNKDANKATHKLLASMGAGTNDYIQTHIAHWEGQFDTAYRKLRREVNPDGRSETMLDQMEVLPLNGNTHAKSLADRMIEDSFKAGKQLSKSEQIAIRKRCAKDIAYEDLTRLGRGYVHGIVEDPSRGRLIGIISPQLTDQT